MVGRMPVNTADVAPTGTSTTGDSGTVDTTNPVTPDVDPGVQDTATFNPCTDADTADGSTDGAEASATPGPVVNGATEATKMVASARTTARVEKSRRYLTKPPGYSTQRHPGTNAVTLSDRNRASDRKDRPQGLNRNRSSHRR